MPGYKGHLAGGVGVYLFLLFALQHVQPSYSTVFAWLVAVCAGALFPDIDIKSKGQKYFYWVILAALCICIVQYKHTNSDVWFSLLAGTAVLAVVPMLVRHRGITHKPWFILTLGVFLWLGMCVVQPHHVQTSFLYALFFTAGAVSHIWLDGVLFRRRFTRKKH